MPTYITTIGLEIHTQILTTTKMFCGCSAAYAGAAPNTHTCPVCLGLPGSLPVINRRAIELATLTGLAFNCQVSPRSIIARKNYFYPDLPSGYQRSQYEQPLCTTGSVMIDGDDGQPVAIGLTRIHVEEDTGKSFHVGSITLLDFNRSGVPLMEIVSEPDIRSPEEARRFFQKLRQTLVWLGVSSGNMEDGALRCDANVSVRPAGQAEYNPKVEIKNMNSFRAVERALSYEVARQTRAIEAGQRLIQETRGWDDAQGVTVPQRTKEYADDYRYFPEPDVPPLVLADDWVEHCRTLLPELPDTRRTRFVSAYGLPPADAEVLTAERAIADYFEAAVAAAPAGTPPRAVANWVTGELFRLLKEQNESITTAATRLKPEYVGAVIGLLADGTINNAGAKAAFEESYRTGEPPAAIVQARGLAQISDAGFIQQLAREAIAANPRVVADYRGGKKTALQFLVGQVMKASKGRARPQAAQAALEAELDSP